MEHRKVTSAVIARPVDAVFDWVARPALWPRVSPVTLRMENAADRVLRAGDTFREHVVLHSWRGHIDWRVESVEAPHRIVLSGRSGGDTLVSRLTGHDDIRLEITLDGDARQTRLTRAMSYHIGLAEAVADLFGFDEAFDKAADVTMTTLAATLNNPLLHGARPDSTSEEWLHHSDPLADEAVASLVTADGDCEALEQFIAGLYRGAPALDAVPPAMRRFFEVTAELPQWACEPQINAASRVFLDWGVLAVGAHICASLPETYVMPRTAKLLNLTRQLDADPSHADRRLWFTVRMCFDVLNEHGLSPQGDGRLALQRLRLIHALIRLFVQHRLETPNRLAKLSSEALWDTHNGQPISQLELLHTLLTFSHVVVRALRILGAELTPYQAEAYIHIWNVAAAQLGIRPELLPRDADDAARMFEAIKSKYARATPEAISLGRALVWFWTSLYPEAVRKEATELMQYVISQLLSPETAKINGLDQLPSFNAEAASVVKASLDVTGTLCADVFEDVPGARQATALCVSLLMHERTESYERKSGTFDVPQQLYARWRGVAP